LTLTSRTTTRSSSSSQTSVFWNQPYEDEYHGHERYREQLFFFDPQHWHKLGHVVDDYHGHESYR
jgi:hypothetical protein